MKHAGKPLVIIESPLKGDYKKNTAYALKALRHSIISGECPLAGHLLYTRVLRDTVPEERALGISLHLAWIRRADRLAVYRDLGISEGMQRAIDYALQIGIPVDYREIGGWHTSEEWAEVAVDLGLLHATIEEP